VIHPPSEKESPILVVVSMMTHNHEGFIEKAVESVMMQQTTFDYRLILMEDCSTDGTLPICKRLQQKYPKKIQLVANRINLGVMKNTLQIYKACFSSGARYVAMIDGDDYWTDENKLQKQIDFLEANDEYAICFHETEMLELNGHIHPMLGLLENCSFTITDLLKRNFIPLLSAMFRVHDALNGIEAGFSKLSVYDWVLHLTNAEQGKIYYMKDCMAVYRIHPGGHWSLISKQNALKKYLGLMDELDQYFHYKYHEEFKNGKKKILDDYYNGTSFLASPPGTILFKVKRSIRRMLS
jgi:glycosyltransferase involved in cell wall biosynthesis